MTTITTETTEVLNDLIKINYDRIEGYRRSAEESKAYDIELNPVFKKMVIESRVNVSALSQQVRKLGGAVENTSSALGEIYRTWMCVKAAFTGKDRFSILASCDFGEDHAHHAYEEALTSDADLDVETRQLITLQKETLKQSHDILKSLMNTGK